MTQNISGIIADPCIVSFTGNLKVRILCGTLVKDLKGRWPDGAGLQFHSSPVLSIDGDLVKTENSLYQTQGEIEYLELPLKAILHIKQHIDPRHIKAMTDAGFTIVDEA